MLTTAAPDLLGRRYVLHERIGRGGMGEVYRATDRLHNQQVALKRVLASSELILSNTISSTMDFRVALAQEFKILASLRHPHIISVLDYGFDAENQPFITMELLEDARTIIDAGRDLSLPERVEMLIQVFQALAYLHRRGILHRDIKPSNLLQADGKVKLLDFGLSVARGEVSDSDDITAGTLSYMAPEIIQGKAPSEASDLYALGVIAYELLTGKHPFKNTNVNQMVDDILHAPPDFERVKLDDRMVLVLDKLLQKDPALRYASAHDVLAFYAEATNQPTVLENEATRESFLQAARFVGRDAELEKLLKALAQAREGKGSAWLIGGESGVGKSRLLDELRTHALVDRMFVLRGQAVSERGVPYQIWRAPLRWLALQTDLTDLQISVLKDLIPDIEALLERRVPAAPKLDSQATQERLLGVIEDVFLQQDQPVLLILEDLHWVGSESLKVLAHLSRHASYLPLVLVGSYRDDERPKLPEELPDMQRIRLERLSESAIADLSESMLGKDGRDEQIVELLHRESEGNVFFLVEVVRALAERAGRLENIAHITLPERVFAGGMQQIVQRRIEHVPPEARPLLHVAVLIGRKVDVPLLKAIAQRYGYTVNMEQWLSMCGNAAVLDVLDEQWQFAHDKIREGLQAQMTPKGKIALHQQIAETMEALHAENPVYTAALAYHWDNAGHKTKAIEYHDKAGEQAVSSYANLEAIGFLTRAAALDSEPERGRQLHRESLLGQAYLGAGRLRESRTHLEKALALLGYKVPASKGRLILGLLRRLGQQLFHRIAFVVRRARSDVKRENLLHATRLYEKITEIFFYNSEIPSTIYCSLCTLNLAERAGPSAELARSYANLAVVAGLVRLRKLGDVYSESAVQTAQMAGDPSTQSRVLSRVGLYHCGLGRWEQAEKYLSDSMQIAERIGDYRQWGEAAALKLNLLHLTARYQESIDLCHQITRRSARTGDVQQQMWGFNYQAQSVLRMNRIEEAYTLLRQAEQLIEHHVSLITSRIINHGLLALASLRRGSTQEALAYAALTAREITDSRSPNVFSLLEGYACTAEVYLELWEGNTDSAERACKSMFRYARRFPIGQPRAWLLQGILHRLQGELSKAEEAWQKSLEFARHYRMTYDEGLALYHLGKNGHPDFLPQAAAIFESIHATHELHLTRRALEDKRHAS